jgi:hypothetical protein
MVTPNMTPIVIPMISDVIVSSFWIVVVVVSSFRIVVVCFISNVTVVLRVPFGRLAVELNCSYVALTM